MKRSRSNKQLLYKLNQQQETPTGDPNHVNKMTTRPNNDMK